VGSEVSEFGLEGVESGISGFGLDIAKSGISELGLEGVESEISGFGLDGAKSGVSGFGIGELGDECETEE